MCDGGQAFPSSEVRDEFGDIIQAYRPGMTLRDWFAGQALAGLYADSTVNISAEKAAEAVYKTADAMLRFRKQ